MTDFGSRPYIDGCALVTMYRAAFPELTPECLLQEMLARGPRWFARWWADASPATRENWLKDSHILNATPSLP
jgi:hypothetical protein